MSESDERSNEIRVHIDTLEYTREGLRTREDLDLRIGAVNRVVLVRPARVPAVAAGHAAFAVGTSFPTPAFLSVLIHEHDGNVTPAFGPSVPSSAVYQIFAHADASGGDDHNKALTDRRARVARAMLSGDVDVALAAAEDEGWDDELHQVMLRALACDPGPIDGKPESMTADGVTRFQSRYLEGAFHHGKPVRNAALEVDGVLGSETRAALVESYVTAHTPGVDSSRFHDRHPANGCAAFNSLEPLHADYNRRLTLVVHRSPPPYPSATPCTEGSAAACPVMDDSPMRCTWYREHIAEVSPEEVRHRHFRLGWLHLPNGRYLLSALTTVADTVDVEFQVFAASQPVDGEVLHDPEALVQPLSEITVNKPRHGVAQVVWDPPPDFKPGDDGRMDVEGRPLVPVFRVRHGASRSQAHDSWPASDIVVRFHRRGIGGAFEADPDTRIELVSSEGMRASKPATDATPMDDASYGLRFEGFPRTGRYSLYLHQQSNEPRTLFEDVPYDQLDGGTGGTKSPPSTSAHHFFDPGEVDEPDEDDELEFSGPLPPRELL